MRTLKTISTKTQKTLLGAISEAVAKMASAVLDEEPNIIVVIGDDERAICTTNIRSSTQLHDLLDRARVQLTKGIAVRQIKKTLGDLIDSQLFPEGGWFEVADVDPRDVPQSDRIAAIEALNAVDPEGKERLDATLKRLNEAKSALALDLGRVAEASEHRKGGKKRRQRLHDAVERADAKVAALNAILSEFDSQLKARVFEATRLYKQSHPTPAPESNGASDA
jgi:hypothetical protein